MQDKYYLKAKRIFTENGILENQAVDALEAGACGGVHIFNGMSGIHHRDSGCAGAVFT